MEPRTVRGYPRSDKPLICGEGRTKQEFRDECDINVILARYKRTGQITHISEKIPRYGDFSQVGDYLQASLQVAQMEASFLDLPSNIRKHFGHDPQQLVEFMADPANHEEGIQLGLFESKSVPIEPATVPDEAPSEPETGDV